MESGLPDDPSDRFEPPDFGLEDEAPTSDEGRWATEPERPCRLRYRRRSRDGGFP